MFKVKDEGRRRLPFLLTFNIFCYFFYCFYCGLWSGIYLLGWCSKWTNAYHLLKRMKHLNQEFIKLAIIITFRSSFNNLSDMSGFIRLESQGRKYLLHKGSWKVRQSQEIWKFLHKKSRKKFHWKMKFLEAHLVFKIVFHKKCYWVCPF